MKRGNKADWLYRQLKMLWARMKKDEMFPSVRTISSEYKVSSVLANNAMRRLAEEGLVKSVVGKGTYVNKGNSSLKIMMLSPSWHGYSADVEWILREETGSRGYQFTTLVYDYDEDFYFRLPYNEADVIIIRPSGAPLSPEHLTALANAPIPVIFITSSIEAAGFYSIGGDNVASGRLAAEYLIEHGHRRLAFLESELSSVTSEELYRGFDEVCTKEGIKFEFIRGDWKFGDNLSQCNYRFLSRKFKDRKPEFSGIFAMSDVNAIGVLKAFADCNIKVPEEVSVIGFGGDSLTALFSPALSVVEISRKQMALEILRLIDDFIAGRKPAHGRINIPPRVVERDSVNENLRISQDQKDVEYRR